MNYGRKYIDGETGTIRDIVTGRSFELSRWLRRPTRVLADRLRALAANRNNVELFPLDDAKDEQSVTATCTNCGLQVEAEEIVSNKSGEDVCGDCREHKERIRE